MVLPKITFYHSYTLLLIVFLISFGMQGQATDTIQDLLGQTQVIRYDGNTKTLKDYDLRGQLISIARYTNGQLHGEQKAFYPKGQLMNRAQYEQGFQVGRYVYYYGNGNLGETSYYKIFEGEGGRESFKHGEQKEFYPNGQLKNITRYEQGLQVGEDVRYYANGNLAGTLYFKIFEGKDGPESLRHGEIEQYHVSGYLQVKGRFEKGEREGLWLEYNKDGLEAEKEYVDGKVHGSVTLYYKNGEVMERYHYYDEVVVNGTLLHTVTNGKRSVYYESGNIKKVQSYKWGKLVGEQKEYFENGQLKSLRVIDEDRQNREITGYDEQGRKTAEVRQKRDTQNRDIDKWMDHGKNILWRDGVLYRDENYLNDNLHGKSKVYYQNASLKSSENYINGIKSGVQKYYRPDGSLIKEEGYASRRYGNQYKQMPNGWHREWTEEGKLLEEAFYFYSEEPVYKVVYDPLSGILLELVHSLGSGTGDFWKLRFYPNGSIQSDYFGSKRAGYYKNTFLLDGRIKSIEIAGTDAGSQTTYLFNAEGELIKTTTIPEYKAAAPDYRDFLIDPDENSFYQKKKKRRFEITYANGQTRLKGRMKNNKLEGDLVFYSPDGKKLALAQFEEGLPNGEYWFRNLQGDTIFSTSFKGYQE